MGAPPQPLRGGTRRGGGARPPSYAPWFTNFPRSSPFFLSYGFTFLLWVHFIHTLPPLGLLFINLELFI